MDIRTTSTHVERKDRRLNDDWLEILLEDWGFCQREGIRELEPSIGSYFISELRMAGKKVWMKCKQTRIVQGKVPNYMPHRRIDKVNRVINDLPPHLHDFIKARYEHGYSHKDMRAYMSKTLYYERLKEAKQHIRRGLHSARNSPTI